ncbi:hypothetical protein YC2023_031955 [Brassica napus]
MLNGSHTPTTKRETNNTTSNGLTKQVSPTASKCNTKRLKFDEMHIQISD